MKTIAIRREDKNQWERRAPLTPADVTHLAKVHGIRTRVQPSDLRIFSDNEYRDSGAEITENIEDAEIILGIKEIPPEKILDEKTYLFFSHTIKGQSYNMGMLAELIRRRATLIDYERIVDEAGRRLIFFGRHAGLAGMIETLRAFGLKCRARGVDSPFATLRQPYEYDSLGEAMAAVRALAPALSSPEANGDTGSMVIGIAGYGNVSKGAQEIVDLLPHASLSPAELRSGKTGAAPVVKVVYREEDMVTPLSGDFDLQDYYDNPGKYRSIFEPDLPRMTIFVNSIYWTEDYPRLVTRRFLREHADDLKLQVIGDISIDIEGAVEISHKATLPDEPCFTYHPALDRYDDGIGADGITVMAVDNLPCELSREASEEFSSVLREFLPGAAGSTGLPAPLERARILDRGEFTPSYTYMKNYVSRESV